MSLDQFKSPRGLGRIAVSAGVIGIVFGSHLTMFVLSIVSNNLPLVRGYAALLSCTVDLHAAVPLQAMIRCGWALADQVGDICDAAGVLSLFGVCCHGTVPQ